MSVLPSRRSVLIALARCVALSAGAALVLGCGARADREFPREKARPGALAAGGPEKKATEPSMPPVAVAPPAALRAPGPPGPVLNPELHRLRRAAQARVLGRQCPPGPRAFPYAPLEPVSRPVGRGALIATERAAGARSMRAPSAGEPREKREPPPLGRFVPIEPDSTLDHFHQALAHLAAGKGGDDKVRILAYGASHTQADTYTGYLRTYLQGRFGDGGQGFVLLGRVNKWYRTLDTRARHETLTIRRTRYEASPQDEPLGLFGAALVGTSGYGEIVTSKDSTSTRFEVQYFAEPQGGDFDVLVDGQVVAAVKTKARTPGPAYRTFEASPGRHEIRARLTGNGPVRLFGITAETAGRGVVVDTLGIGGARMESHLHWREDAWIDAVRHRHPDLVTFAYGTNEATGSRASIEVYERQIRAIVGRLRKAAPLASCVFISPFDLPAQKDGHWMHRPRLVQIVEAQRRISRELGCGFWDGYAFMGGKGSMVRWASAEPPLAAEDHIHLTRQGYVYAGIAIGDALMRGYDLEEAHPADAVAPPPPPPAPGAPPPAH